MNFKTTNKLTVAILLLFGCVTLFLNWPSVGTVETPKKAQTAVIKENYQHYIMEHPFRRTMKMSKRERLEIGLPPNKYYEQEWLYTSDPVLLRPAPERVHQLQEELKNNPGMRTVPGEVSNAWVERGPNNVGGRTHVLMFAPGSTTKVFAGSVSGGLWINDDITSAASVWYQAPGVPSNLAVMCMTVDPNDSNIMYLGTGEVYTWGAVNGNGIYKSEDGGNTWSSIFTGGSAIEDKITYVQDIIAWNNPLTSQTEIFFGADAMAYTEEVSSTSGGTGWNWLGANTIGLYKSTDGTNFSRLTGSLYESSPGNYFAPNDFDIDAAGNLWMGTKYSYYTGEGGGRVFRNNGSAWSLVRDLGDNGRVELACSKQTANKIYALCEDRTDAGNPVKIYLTSNAFSSAPTSLAQPNDDDTGIDPTDFTRGQSFYDLMIGVDPNNDATLYAGGIDLFKSTNSGSSWTQFSHWYGGFGHQEVHADQHGIAFANSNRVIFGNDGGVFYSNNGGTTTSARNNGFNVTQFYKAAINQPTGTTKLLAGAQDNGSQLINGAAPGINSSTEVTGGDGCWAFIDQDSEYMVSSYVYNNYRYITYGGSYVGNFPSATNDGDFVNQCGLDSDTNVLYSNGTTGTTYRIYRWAINPAGPSVTKTTLTNALIDAIPTFFVASPYTSDRILFGTALGRVVRMNNASGTTSYTDISIPGQIGAVSDIRYGQSEAEIMVTFHNYGVNSIWYTTNGGTSWVSKEGDLPDMPVKCILQNPLNTDEVIVGTELGVWATYNFSDTNPNWVQSQNGMSDVKVLSFDFRSADNTIVAATFGRGMFTGQFFGAPVPVSCSNTISSLPYTESFESGLGVWSQASGDDGDWIEFTGATPSSGTGPSGASDGSMYLYIEASSNGTTGEIGANATAILDGPCVELSALSNVQVEFDYHTYGANIGSIVLQGSINENIWFDLFTTPGVDADAWVTASVDLSAYTEDMKLRIVGTTGNGFASDLGIDNIHISIGCPSSSEYTGSWDISPSSSSSVVISANYDTATSVGSFDACELRVATGATLTVRSGDYLNIQGDIIIEAGATLLVEHQGSVVQVDDDAIVTNNGTVNVGLTTPNLASRDFMVLGSPMSGDTRNGVWNAAFLVLNHTTANFVPNPAVAAAFPLAENFADDNYDNWTAYAGNINIGEGYIVRPQSGYGQPGGVFNYTYSGGTLNNGVVNFPIVYNGTQNASPNILANPYASAIWADDFINANSMVDEVYFWEHNTPPSNAIPGAGAMNFSMEDISMYNLSGGVAAATGGTAPNGYIATGQGFGVKATAAGTAVFNNSMRRTDNNNTLRNQAVQMDRIWLKVEDATYGTGGSTLLAFRGDASAALENGFDSRRLATVVSLFSHLQDGSGELGIQSMGTFNQAMKIPLGFSTLVAEEIEYTISIDQLEGANIEQATIYLWDKLEGVVTELSAGDYTFKSNKGSFSERFSLYFEREALGVQDNFNATIGVYPNPTTGVLQVASQNSAIEQVTLFDIQGREVRRENFESSLNIRLDIGSLTPSVYFMVVKTEHGSVTKKVVKK